MNDVKLQSEAGIHPLDSNLRPLKIGDKVSPLELSETDVRVNNLQLNGSTVVVGDIAGLDLAIGTDQLKISYDASNYAVINVVNDGHLELANTGTDGDITLDSASDIYLEAHNQHVYLGGYIDFDLNGSGGAGASMKLMSILDTGDYFMIDTTTHGATTITTVDDDNAEAAHLTFDIQGDTIFKGDIADGTSTEVMRVDSANSGVKVANIVYFAAETATTVGHLGTETINWNTSQKQKLTITGTGIAVQFTNPAGACNLLLKVVQGDGSDVIGTWDSDIKWAGGSAPTLSTGNGEIDILSFYFDGTNYFGVASLDFS